MTKPKVKPKKADKSRDSSAPGSSTEMKGTPSTASPDVSTGGSQQASAPIKSATRVNFIVEIQSMMYALGDCRRPLHESAALVEEIAHQQVTALLQKASEVCVQRSARFISIEDFIFLARKDRDKLRRLVKFLHFKDQKQKFAKMLGGVDEEESYSESDQKAHFRRRKICLDMLTTIDNTGELISILEADEIDPVKQERLERADRYTSGMDAVTYQEYTEARQINFAKKASKFKEWLDYSSLQEPKPNQFALEILAYVAYETVAQLVDLSLFVQRDMVSTAIDPVSKTVAPKCHNDIPSLIPQPPLQLVSSPGATPIQSPTSSPTSPTGSMASPFLSSSNASNGLGASGNSTSSDGSQPSGQAGETKSNVHSGGTTGKSKSKKKKKPSPVHVLSQYRAIQPYHVREAWRRHQERHQPMAAFSKYVSEYERIKFLAS